MKNFINPLTDVSPTAIAVGNSGDGPLVTFALFAYNQEQYIREAIEGALAQNYSPLEIIISDDFSTDKTFDIIKRMAETYSGPHKLLINKNKKNIGLISHVEEVTKMASGDIIIAAAGDDISMPHRVRRIINEFTSFDNCCYIHSAALKMDHSGLIYGKYESPGISNFVNIFQAATSRSLALGATAAWVKPLIANFSSINNRIWAEDLIIGFRGLLIGRVCYIDEPLVKYRYGVGVVSKKLSKYEYRSRNHQIRKQRLRDSVESKRWFIALFLLGLTLDSLIRKYLGVFLGKFKILKYI